MLERLEQLGKDIEDIPLMLMRDVVVRLAKNELLQEEAVKVFLWAFEMRAKQPALLAVAKRLDKWVAYLDAWHREDPDRNPVPEFIREALAQLKEQADA